MATPAQITANRLNAQKSTGPRSAEGKAASRFNALKHAASAESSIIPGEEETALAELSQAYRDQFHPIGPEEELLIEKVVAADWIQRRMHRLETEVLNALIDEQDPEEANPLGRAFIDDCHGPNALQKIFRRREAASRDWYRAIAQLRQLQLDRMARHSLLRAARPSPRPAAPQPPSSNSAPVPSPSSSQAPNPAAKIGFVFDKSTPPSWRL